MKRFAGCVIACLLVIALVLLSGLEPYTKVAITVVILLGLSLARLLIRVRNGD